MTGKASFQPVFHPLCFAAFPLISLFQSNLKFMASTDDLWLPLLVVLLVTILIWTLLGLMSKTVEKSALITSWLVFLFLIYGHVLRSFMLFVYASPDLNLFLLLYTAISIAGAIFLWRIPKNAKLNDVTFVLNLTSFALLIMPLSQIIMFQQNSFDLSKKEQLASQAKQASVPENHKPDIYYIILDGMERLDVLERDFNVNCSSFRQFLKENDFYLAENSHSNYPFTVLSLSSSLNMQYINPIAAQNKDGDWHTLYEMIKDNEVLKFLKKHSYRCIHLDSSWGITRKSPDADEVLSLTWANSFVATAAALTPIGIHYRYFPQVHDELRAHRMKMLELPGEIARSPGPKFVFVHIMMPHMPYLFGENGEARNGSLNMHFEEWTEKESYTEQVIFLLKELEKSLKYIIKNSKKDPLIVVQGDHGAGTSAEFNEENPSQAFLRERFSILNAYHLPETHEKDKSEPVQPQVPSKTKPESQSQEKHLYSSISPVNSFRVIFDKYFDAQLEILPDKSYFAPYEKPYLLKDVTEEIKD